MAARLHGMRILEQRPGFLVCRQTPTLARGLGLMFAVVGAGALVLVSSADPANLRGSPWVAYVVGAMCMILGVYLFSIAEDDRIVLDGAAHVARIIRKGLWRQSTTEVPFASITDVALEVTVPVNQGSTTNQQFTWRPVFVCQNRRVPWTPISTSDRASQARAVAAARAVGGWHALPIDGSPALGRAVSRVQNLGCLYAFAALFIGFLLWITVLQVRPLLTWKATAATVVSSDVGYVQTSKGKTWKPVIKYTYSVAGAEYSSYKVAPLEQSAGQNWARSISRQFQPGATVTAWYDPQKPSDAYIYRHFATIPFIMMGVMGAFLVFFVLIAKRANALSIAALTGGDVPVVSA